MKLLERLFNLKKEEQEENFELPDYFEITEEDINKYLFMTKGKTFTSPKELSKDGYKINKEIEEYKRTKEYKILSTDFNNLDFIAISVEKPPYIDGSVDLTLGLNDISFKRYLFNPSEGLAVIRILNKNNNFSLANFLNVLSPCFLNTRKVVYRKGKCLEFTYKLSFLRGEYDNNNEEITFISNIEEKDVKSISEYILTEEEKDYKLSLISDQKSKIIIQNLSVGEQELSILNEFYNQLKLEDFKDLSILQFEKFNKKIAFISIMNDTLIVKGNDKDENTIYTTLKEDELSDGMKSLLDVKVKKYK